MISIFKIHSEEVLPNGIHDLLELRGLSTDVKPSKINNREVQNGSTFFEIDTGDEYMYDLDNKRWRKISSNSGEVNYAPRYISFNNYLGTDLDYETSNLDISNLEIMDYMFTSDIHLLNLDLSNWNTQYITSFMSMFSNCRELKTLDCSNFTLDSLSNVYGLNSMFNNCESLEKLDIRNMILSSYENTPNNFMNSVPIDCQIIVKNNDEKTWWNTNYPSYTNIEIAE